MTDTASASGIGPAHLVGRTVLIVVDIQGGAGTTPPEEGGIPVLMGGRAERRPRVRALVDDHGKQVKQATPSMPATRHRSIPRRTSRPPAAR